MLSIKNDALTINSSILSLFGISSKCELHVIHIVNIYEVMIKIITYFINIHECLALVTKKNPGLRATKKYIWFLASK